MPVGRDGAEINLSVRDLTKHGVWDLSYRIPQFERFTPHQVEDAFTGGSFLMASIKSPELIKKRRADRRHAITEAAKTIADEIVKQIEDAEGWRDEEQRYRDRRTDQRDANTFDLSPEKEPKT